MPGLINKLKPFLKSKSQRYSKSTLKRVPPLVPPYRDETSLSLRDTRSHMPVASQPYRGETSLSLRDTRSHMPVASQPYRGETSLSLRDISPYRGEKIEATKHSPPCKGGLRGVKKLRGD